MVSLTLCPSSTVTPQHIASALPVQGDVKAILIAFQALSRSALPGNNEQSRVKGPADNVLYMRASHWSEIITEPFDVQARIWHLASFASGPCSGLDYCMIQGPRVQIHLGPWRFLIFLPNAKLACW